jgi:hypothetical protein
MIIVDETLTGDRLNSFTLKSVDERMTVREIIRARIWQEVHEYNAARKITSFQGLVHPVDAESRLNRPRSVDFKPIDWEKQYQLAIRAFESNGFFVIVGDRQAESLDETLDVQAETEIGFVKLVPLVGG